MKNTTWFCTLVLCYSGLLAGEAEPQAATMEEMQEAMPVLSPYLRMRDIGRLSQVSYGIHQAVEPAIVTAMENAAIWESQLLNAGYLNLSEQRENYLDNQAFKGYVMQRIKDFATDNPGKWIKLNLAGNSLGNDLKFLRELFQAIVSTVHSLNIDIVVLGLYSNKLSSLPEHLFENLYNLRLLNLDSNQLETLPEHLLRGLNNLNDLALQGNRFEYLPERLFEGLNNLQIISLSYNRLSSLPERLFRN